MGITDELRSFIKDTLLGYASQEQHVKQLTAIAERIDTEHERGMEERADRYSELRAKMNNCYVELPKDANGEVIHLGDVVMLPDWPLCHHEVINLVYAHDGWAIISRHGSIEASEHTVHVKPKKPTVEDVLHDFICDHEEGARDEADLIAEYAKRLRLAGSDAE